MSDSKKSWPFSDEPDSLIDFLSTEIHRLQVILLITCRLRYAHSFRRMIEEIHRRAAEGTLPELPDGGGQVLTPTLASGIMEFLATQFEAPPIPDDVFHALKDDGDDNPFLRCVKGTAEMIADLSCADIENLLSTWEPELREVATRLFGAMGKEATLQGRKYLAEATIERFKVYRKEEGGSVTDLKQRAARALGYEDPRSMERFFASNKYANGGLNLIDQRLLRSPLDQFSWDELRRWSFGRAAGYFLGAGDVANAGRDKELDDPWPWEENQKQDAFVERIQTDAAKRVFRAMFEPFPRREPAPDRDPKAPEPPRREWRWKAITSILTHALTDPEVKGRLLATVAAELKIDPAELDDELNGWTAPSQ